MTVPTEEAPANSVPAAAVIRRVQALFGITGRKECVGVRQVGSEIPGLNLGIAFKTADLEYGRG